MTYRLLATSAAVAAMCVFVSLTPLPVPAQAPATQPKAAPRPRQSNAAISRAWTVPRTPDGKPDLQGIWSNATVTPLERPQGAKEFATPEEAAATEKRGNRDPTAPVVNGRGVGDYNAIWWELGKKVLENNRTSIITDPSGKLPPLTPEAQKKVAANNVYARLHPADGPEDLDNIERCITWITSGPPMLPTFYNNMYQIFQTPNYVAILVEMVHDVRIIPLDGRPHSNAAIRQWVGDSRGHWEGDTLVVETTNFNGKRGYIGGNRLTEGTVGTNEPAGGNAEGGGGRSGAARNDEKMRVIERFTRTAPDTILYQFMVDDPGTYTKPWSGEIPMKATTEPLYEYACHEGNYAMMDILSGARADEKAAAAKGSVK